jgi:KaiC/GvpD/RAD55 family RecA-like ATPase
MATTSEEIKMFAVNPDNYYTQGPKIVSDLVANLYDEWEAAEKRLSCLEKAEVPEQDEQLVEDEMTRLYDRIEEIKRDLEGR